MAAIHHDDHDRGAPSAKDGSADARNAIDAPNVSLLSSPLDFLFTEHLRQRQFAKLLMLIADGVINRRSIAGAALFIENDLAQHIRDEETSFFPLLRPLCDAEDNIDALLSLLAAEHREDESASDTILGILRAMAAGGEASDTDRAALRDFTEHLRHHLALENGVLLPIARMRMTKEALDLLAQSMSLRRRAERG